MAAWDGSGPKARATEWLPPRSTPAPPIIDATETGAFSGDDIHGYIEIFHRLGVAGAFGLGTLAGATLLTLILLGATNGH